MIERTEINSGEYTPWFFFGKLGAHATDPSIRQASEHYRSGIEVIESRGLWWRNSLSVFFLESMALNEPLQVIHQERIHNFHYNRGTRI